MIRVITGKARGRKLKTVPGENTRPITDRVKEALFNIIGPDIAEGDGATMLDLFGGTGSVGVEALSRGASFVRFVDIDRVSVATIRANLELTGLGKNTEVVRTDAFSLLARQADRSFDYIYIAPPQYHGSWKRALLALDANPGWLSEDGWAIIQIHPIEYEPFGDETGNPLKNLEEFEQRHYGSTLLIFYERKLE